MGGGVMEGSDFWILLGLCAIAALNLEVHRRYLKLHDEQLAELRTDLNLLARMPMEA